MGKKTPYKADICQAKEVGFGRIRNRDSTICRHQDTCNL
jgi:hypothetical protein